MKYVQYNLVKLSLIAAFFFLQAPLAQASRMAPSMHYCHAEGQRADQQTLKFIGTGVNLVEAETNALWACHQDAKLTDCLITQCWTIDISSNQVRALEQ